MPDKFGNSRSEHRVRAEYAALSREIAAELQFLRSNLEVDMDPIFIPLPFLDNSYLGSSDVLEEALVLAIENEEHLKTFISKVPLRKKFRRSNIAIALEAIAISISHMPDIHVDMGEKFHILVFTYVGRDDKSKEQSIINFWGELCKRGFHEINWGFIGAKKSGVQLKDRFIMVFTRVRIVREYFLQLPKRIWLWKGCQSLMSKNSLWLLLRDAYKRAIFGQPAIMSLYFLHRAKQILFEKSPSVIITPYENQAWERSISVVANSLGIKHIGWLHVPLRFWDLRMIQSSGYENFYPSTLVSIDESSDHLLPLDVLKTTKLTKGPALRYSHLETSGNTKKAFRSKGKVLIGSGYNKEEAVELRKLMTESFKHSEDFKVFHRPHPSNRSWFQKIFPFDSYDDHKQEQSLSDYEYLITDKSSIAIEAAVDGCKVLVFVPEGKLNLSPLHMTSEHYEIFSDENSLRRAMGKARTRKMQNPMRRHSDLSADFFRILGFSR